MKKDLIIVEFSVKQDAFHTSTAMDMLKNNINNIFLGKKVDYIPIGIFNTYEDANNFINSVRDKF